MDASLVKLFSHSGRRRGGPEAVVRAVSHHVRQNPFYPSATVRLPGHCGGRDPEATQLFWGGALRRSGPVGQGQGTRRARTPDRGRS
jgi:hypothetical protein